MRAQVQAQIDQRTNERMARGFSMEDALRMSLSEVPVTKTDAADYARAMGVEVRTSWTRTQIIASILG
jgi:hypothetical protein